MAPLLGLVLLLSPETERMLLGPSPFFRHEGLERALRENDTALLEKAAASEHWDARRLAAEGLGPRTPPSLLEDPVAVVREAAARALDLTAPEPALLKLVKDKDDAVRAAAAWALRARAGQRELRPLLKDPFASVRVAALAATGNDSRLRSLALGDDLADALPALAMLGRSGGASEAALLLRQFRRSVATASKSKVPWYLRDAPSSDVALARALGDMARRGIVAGGKPLADHLRALAEKSDLQGSSGILLAEAVAGARDAEAARRVLDAQLRVRRESTLPMPYLDPGVRAVMHALARDPWPELAPLLLPFLEDSDPFVRLATVRALHGNAARPALRDPHPLVRAAACAQVGRPDRLLEMLEDPAPVVAVAALRELGRLGDDAAAPAVAGMLAHGAEPVRLAAVGALLRLAHDGRAALLYASALADPSPQVRAAAAAVLDFLDLADDAVPQAIADLGNESRETRARSLALLHALVAARFAYDPDAPAAGKAQWEEWWARRKERERPPDAFRYHVEDLRRKGLDVVLVMDATGSMAPVIEATKRRLEAVARELRHVVPDLRVRVVAYRDSGDAFVTLGSPLTHDARVLEDFLACVPAAGGGDAPEAVLAGLKNAITQTPWRPGTHRVVLLFGDAPPHGKDEVLLEAVLKEFDGHVHAVDVGGYGSGGLREPMSQFQRIATWGRGAAVTLADEHDLLRNLLVLTLGPRYRTAVETLFGL